MAELPLKKCLDSKLFRLLVLGALNSTQGWHAIGRAKPREVTDCLFRMINESMRDSS